jgi:hypothetical protein
MQTCYDDITLSGEGATIGPFYTDTELCSSANLFIRV